MINIESIFEINKRNRYEYIFDEDNGNGYYFGSFDGNGRGFSNRFGCSDGDGDSYFSDFLIKDYRND